MSDGPRRPLRVAEFTDNYGPGRSGILYALQQIEGSLLDAGHEVIVVAPKAKGPNPHKGRVGRTEVRLPSIKVVGVPARLATGQRAEDMMIEVAALIPDVIHVHGLGLVGLMGVALARRTGIPLIVTWHTDWDAYAEYYGALTPVMDAAYRFWRVRAGDDALNAEDEREGAARSTGRVWTRDLMGASAAMLAAATVVTCPSEKTAARVLKLCPEAAVRSIPNGVDRLPAAGNHVRRAPFRRVRFLYVGRISPEKGINLLLDAYKIVRRTTPETELMLVGDWKRTPQLHTRLSRWRAQKRVTLVGEVDRSQLRAYYAAADVFVFPSQTDTQALVLHEAAYEGLPIVSVDRELRLVISQGVNGEYVEDTPDSLAGAMLRMIDRVRDPQWRDLAAETGRSLASHYSVADQDARMLALYTEVADAARAATKA